ncbi:MULTISPECIES: glycosyltransferase family 2 protein [unclassified Exiguobacterium]|uniref:glycosyltransferase n=1 Tax=unclassified Exiguobacterium TaxID=2644629 RepID=UPI0010387D6E|nr:MULTISPECIES: glycosyltransferase family 2 protein [unclassified Exiguobacterium]TCI24026.1 glycosyltransferase [Exiguobacterium sp. SH5S4]TCI49661.1 glycosyltransferase [Exiguobacterium sp. SH5S13]TCI59954.1 glycosyltransferase [Exiguobacterium sp. SH3S1]
MILFVLTGLMFLFTLVNLAFLRPLTAPIPVPPTALCVPLRNEERNVPKLINSLKPALTAGCHVYLYEDRSEDGTYDALVREIASDDRFTILRGVPLTDGWSGKVHACHQLAIQTREPYLLFLDADVTIDPSFVGRMHGTLVREGAVFLSGFPRFPTPTWLGKLLIPMQHVLIAQHLPLFWRKVRHPAFAAANGMNVLVERTSYEEVGGHASIHDSLIDDIDLCREFKRRKKVTSLVNVSPYITCDMYATNEEVWNGFSKNVFKGMNEAVGIALYFSLYYGVQLSAFIFLLIRPDWISLGASLFVLFARLAIDLKSGGRHFWLHPFSLVAYLVLLTNAVVRKWRRKPITWKGRMYH